MSVPLYQKAATKLSRRGVVGAFTGLGGNLFDGNRFYYADLCRAGAVRRLVRELVDDEMNALGAFVMFVLQPLTSEPHRLAEEQRTMDFAGVDSIVEWSDVPHRRTLPSVSVEPPSFETAERLVLWQSFTDAYTDFALDSINRIADKRGIEFHHPLLDSRLISMVFDAQLGTLRSHGTAKHLFKTAVDDRLPNSVLNQSTDANGYSPIVQRDLRTSARSSVENLLDDPHVATFGFIDATALSEFCRDFLSSDHNNHRPIWRFVVVNRWLKSISSGTTNLQ